MLSKTLTSATYGIDAYLVEVETHVEKQIPGFIIVGLPDNAVRESRERVIAAIKNSDIKFPLKKFTINLAPADIKKEGSSFDLAIAVGILAAEEIVSDKFLSDTIFLGELSLDGTLQPIKGVLPIAINARKEGFEGFILPKQNVREAAVVDKLKVYGAENIKEVIDFLNDEIELEQTVVDTRAEFYAKVNNAALDFADVKGQENVKRALEIAAAGGHNIIIV